jgi:hypothetical protein
MADDVEELAQSVLEYWDQIYGEDEMYSEITRDMFLGIQYAKGVINGDCVLTPEGVSIVKETAQSLSELVPEDEE